MNDKALKNTVGLLGLGNIGMGYDLALDGNYVLTHARAVSLNEASHLLFGVDIQEKLCHQFSLNYNSSAFLNYESAIQAMGNPDFWVCALHPNHRQEFIQHCIQFKPNGLIIEKPFTASEMDNLHQLVHDGVFVLPNFPRLFEPKHKELEDILKNEDILYVKCFYPKDWWSNGVHFVAQILQYFGEPNSIYAHPHFRQIEDRILGQVSFYYLNFQVDFIGIDNDIFNIAEIEILTQSGRHLIQDSGRLYGFDPIVHNPIWGLEFIGNQTDLQSTELNRYQACVWDFFIQSQALPMEHRQSISLKYLSIAHQAQKWCAEALSLWQI